MAHNVNLSAYCDGAALCVRSVLSHEIPQKCNSPMRNLRGPCRQRLACPAIKAWPACTPGRGLQTRASGNASGGGKLDPIESLVGRLFGKKALEEPAPAGLVRMTPTKWPDQYPPTLTEFADPVPGDSDEVASFRPLLKRTSLEKVPLALLYSAEENGWDASSFHKAVDGYGPSVLLGRTSSGVVFGGYNPQGWLGYGDELECISAFLFTWLDGDTSKRAEKLPKVGGSSLAVIDNPDKGPMFSPDALVVPLDPTTGNPRLAKSRLGSYYARLANGNKSLFGGSTFKTDLVELQVYVGIFEEGQGPRVDYKPNMLQWS
eukprot:jgi/Mesvir1/24509/Mv21855-RA.1